MWSHFHDVRRSKMGVYLRTWSSSYAMNLAPLSSPTAGRRWCILTGWVSVSPPPSLPTVTRRSRPPPFACHPRRSNRWRARWTVFASRSRCRYRPRVTWPTYHLSCGTSTFVRATGPPRCCSTSMACRSQRARRVGPASSRGPLDPADLKSCRTAKWPMSTLFSLVSCGWLLSSKSFQANSG